MYYYIRPDFFCDIPVVHGQRKEHEIGGTWEDQVKRYIGKRNFIGK